MTIEEMKNRKRELGYSVQTLSEYSKVPVGTIQKIFSGQTKSPREETLRALEKVLRPQADIADVLRITEIGTDRIAEAAVPYYNTGKGGYTLEDYLNLPEGVRKELIDGVFYDMGEPATIHQGLAGFIYHLLLSHVLEHKGQCMPLMSPCAVQLDRDDKTVVEPDVFVVCDREKFQNRRVFGAPDLVIEILSPSTGKKDKGLKHYKYLEAGVREYWIVDPKTRSVVVYLFENEDVLPKIYGFTDQVPVHIWNGECKIDFKEILEQVEFLYG